MKMNNGRPITKITKVWVVETLTKRSIYTLLRLVRFSTTQTLAGSNSWAKITIWWAVQLCAQKVKSCYSFCTFPFPIHQTHPLCVTITCIDLAIFENSLLRGLWTWRTFYRTNQAPRGSIIVDETICTLIQILSVTYQIESDGSFTCTV